MSTRESAIAHPKLFTTVAVGCYWQSLMPNGVPQETAVPSANITVLSFGLRGAGKEPSVGRNCVLKMALNVAFCMSNRLIWRPFHGWLIEL